ncbi:GNAT family N-acetyltransferase [Haloferax sp. DFSO60]|uniref:GNAT family N-acetyltransferase n=1 Tax=Haloferax sp. DFSO60 TaxID=3388652 RepID=UPI00397E479E
MSVTVLSQENITEWREWFASLPEAGPYHDPDYLTLLSGGFEQEEEVAEAFVYADGEQFVYYPYIRRSLSEVPHGDELDQDLESYSDIVSSWYYGGPILSTEADTDITAEFAEAFSEYCADVGIVSEFLRFDPNIENAADFSVLDPRVERETVRVDLTQSRDEIWDDFEKRNRNAIRQAQETDLVVEPTTDHADYRAFYDIYSNAMDAKNASKHYRFPFSFFEELFSQESMSTFLVARHGDDVVGGAVVVHDGTVAHDYLRASNPDYWDMRVNNLLCYGALMQMKETGHQLFDFQGGRPGVFRFKKGFSQTGRGEFSVATRIHIPEVYDSLVDAARDEGVDTDTGYFPAYRVAQSN